MPEGVDWAGKESQVHLVGTYGAGKRLSYNTYSAIQRAQASGSNELKKKPGQLQLMQNA
jgi:hypothetical protein